MEFLTGVKEKETIGIREILSGDYVGKTVKMNGAVHNIRIWVSLRLLFSEKQKAWCSVCMKREKQSLI